MTHTELCIATMEHFMKESVAKIALYEYKSTVSAEEPDVLIYRSDDTCLYEIKMSRADFLADARKECRKTVRQDHWVTDIDKHWDPGIKTSYLKLVACAPEVFFKQWPHLGNQRFSVCEEGLIKPEEVPEHWGLYYYTKNGKFKQIKRSDNFRSSLKKELQLLMHAMRRHAVGDTTGVRIKDYEGVLI